MIRNGPVASQFSTSWGGVDYNKPGRSMIGLHANAGITFDLGAIREATGIEEMRFNSVAGYGGRTTTPSAEFRVLLDGTLMAHKRLGRKDAAPIDFEIPKDIRFLTLISTDGGNGYSHDQISFGDPRLVPSNPPTLADQAQKRLEKLRKE